MQYLVVACLWVVNCFCWLLIGVLAAAGRQAHLAVAGAVALAITLGLSSMVTLRRPEGRGSQRNPERFYVALPIRS